MSPSLYWASFVGVIMSVGLGVSAPNLLTCWMALELNLLAFMGLMISSMSGPDGAKVKYFLVQSSGSSVLFMGMATSLIFDHTATLLMVGGLTLKLGFAPFHGWFVDLVSLLQPSFILLLMTIQKLVPLVLAMKLLGPLSLGGLVFCGVLMGCGGVSHQQAWKPLLAYSSVFGASWVLLAAPWVSLAGSFLGAYGLAVWVVFIANNLGTNPVASGSEGISTHCGGGPALYLGIGLLSLAGMPPLLGFYVKVAILLTSASAVSMMELGLVVLASIFLLHMYVRLFYSCVEGARNSGLIVLKGYPHTLAMTMLWTAPLALLLLYWY